MAAQPPIFKGCEAAAGGSRPPRIARSMPGLRTVAATRYLTPLREGGSLPAIVEADDEGLYVLKFRGAGQGAKALVAELLAGEIGRRLGLPVPEIVLAELHADLARTEPDPEIQDLIRASAGLNFAIDYLPGALSFDPVADRIDPDLASRIVWFDAFVANLDRTPRNTNLLVWHRRPWLIDHGAALYFHHDWAGFEAQARHPFPLIREHVLLAGATRLDENDAEMTQRLDTSALQDVIALVPDAWLADPGYEQEAGPPREVYLRFLQQRLASPRAFVEEARRAHALHV